jgi:hypothetical protein
MQKMKSYPLDLIKTLTRFNDRASILKDRIKCLKDDCQLKVSEAGIELHGPSDIEIDALVLNLRFFMQRHDGIEIIDIRGDGKRFHIEDLYEKHEIAQKEDVFLARKKIDEILNLLSYLVKDPSKMLSPDKLVNIEDAIIKSALIYSRLGLIGNPLKADDSYFYSNREVFESFIYGKYAHTTKEEFLISLEENYMEFAKFTFYRICKDISDHIFFVKDINASVLNSISHHK